MRRVEWGEVEFFTEAEFACSHCRQEQMQQEFITALDKIRREFGKPIIVSSGYRCPEYNAQISSTGERGPHTTGWAVDIAIAGAEAHALIDLALSHLVTGVGIKQHGPFEGRFIHLDMLKSEGNRNRPWVWSYG